MNSVYNWIASRGKSTERHRFGEEVRALLRSEVEQGFDSAIPAKAVTRVALRLKYQIEQVIPCEIEEWKITKANSPIITRQVLQTAKEAGGKEHGACVVYCLLVCLKWFKRQALLELWDSELHGARATACEVLAKRLIESENDEEYLMRDTLLKRFSIYINGEETVPVNVVERAVDLHALLVIGSSGYQKTLNYLWRGWLVQDEENPREFIAYKHKADTGYWVHMDPDRMRTPRYQNAVQISISIIYLLLYTIAINTINGTGDLDIIEGILYLFTAGFICEEVTKIWKVGRYYIGFWNVFNSTLYALLLVSFATRIIALSHPVSSIERHDFNRLSYNFLAFSAPMFWMRILLYLDSLRFFGAMLVILKVMMKESLIFFALLVIIGVGFLQAFIGLDNNLAAGNGNTTMNALNGSSNGTEEGATTRFIVGAMAKSLMQAPEFDGFDDFSPPFGLLLYYIFTFVVMVVLLNILIALYNSAYESVTDHALDEYMALCASKTMQFVRAPDEHVFIPPFNLIEIFGLVLPFEWWMAKARYEKLCNGVMAVLYAPLLLITAALERAQAKQVLKARARGKADDDTLEEWEQLGFAVREDGVDGSGRGQEESALGQQADGDNGQSQAADDSDILDKSWTDAVQRTRPNVEAGMAVIEIRELKQRVEELRHLLEGLQKTSSPKE